MVRKVIAGQELLKAAGTVTGLLVRWLETQAYIEPDAAESAWLQARESARTLPAAERLGNVPIEKIYVSDSVPTPEEFPVPIEVSSLAGLLAETIQRLHASESIAGLIGRQ